MYCLGDDSNDVYCLGDDGNDVYRRCGTKDEKIAECIKIGAGTLAVKDAEACYCEVNIYVDKGTETCLGHSIFRWISSRIECEISLLNC